MLWLHKRSLFLTPGVAVAIATAVGLSLLPPSDRLQAAWVPFVTGAVTVVAALEAITIAALALVMTFLPDPIFSFMRKEKHGLANHTFPFSITAASAALTALVALACLIGIDTENAVQLRTSIFVSWLLFSWTILSFLALVQLILDYWELKATYIDLVSDHEPPTGENDSGES